MAKIFIKGSLLNNSNVPAYQMHPKLAVFPITQRDLRMPSDAYYDLWMNELEDL